MGRQHRTLGTRTFIRMNPPTHNLICSEIIYNDAQCSTLNDYK